MPDTAILQAGDAPIEFIDLGAQRRRLGRRVDEAILRVVDHGKYIMGPEVAIFEQELAAFCGAKHVLSCANGTDALGLALMAKGIKPGQAVLVPSFTFAATAEVVAWFDAVPVFVDVLEHTFNMDPVSLEAGIATAKRLGLEPAGIIPVDLFGLPAGYDEILAIAAAHELWVICDAAQSFGASYKGRNVGTLGDITTTSFFPAKPLGCYGDGGAVFTDDDDIAAVLKSLRVHGQGSDKYDNVRIGMNARLDTIQAAVLSQKLSIFADEIEARNQLAAEIRGFARGHCAHPGYPRRVHQRLGAIHCAFAKQLRPGCGSGPAQRGRRAHCGLLCQAVAPADGLSALSDSGQWSAGIRKAGCRGIEPADAPLSRRKTPRTASSRLCTRY